ncbi:uncharacterized protein LOC143861452 [Tasmannia lanceolata]|uniref:uncharacterized protein LOC143861452 n=1 Tax=Tasmannia lanceolata TaxID=3420 RepID=UPI004063B500
MKWAVELSELDIRYMPRPAIKAQVLADFVAECTIPQQIIEPEVVQTPAAGKAIATGERTEDGTGTELIPIPPVEQDPSTAEPLWEVHVDLRTRVAVEPIQGIYEACDEHMIKYLSKVRQLSASFKSFEVIRIPRTRNTKADVLSKLAASGYTTLGNICMEFLQKSSIENKAAEVMQVEHESCWMDEIIDYIRSGKLPEAKKEARKVTQRAARFSLDGENLFKRSYTLLYLKCLRPSDAAYALQETHEVIPVDVGTPSPRVTNFNEQLNGDGLRANLDLLEEAREESRIRVAAYKQKVSNYHDSKNTTICPHKDQGQPKLEAFVWSVIDTA